MMKILEWFTTVVGAVGLTFLCGYVWTYAKLKATDHYCKGKENSTERFK